MVQRGGVGIGRVWSVSMKMSCLVIKKMPSCIILLLSCQEKVVLSICGQLNNDTLLLRKRVKKLYIIRGIDHYIKIVPHCSSINNMILVFMILDNYSLWPNIFNVWKNINIILFQIPSLNLSSLSFYRVSRCSGSKRQYKNTRGAHTTIQEHKGSTH